MKDKLIEYSTAKLAKEKGFNEECYFSFAKISKEYCIFKSEYSETNSEINKYEYSAPTQNLLRKWLREKHKIDIIIIVNYNQHKQIKTYRCGIVYIKQLSDRQLIETFFIRPEGEKFLFIEFSTYEEALEKGLQEALKLI